MLISAAISANRLTTKEVLQQELVSTSTQSPKVLIHQDFSSLSSASSSSSSSSPSSYSSSPPSWLLRNVSHAMTLTTREAIAVAELVVYIPAFAIALFVCFRQGFTRQLGFLYLVIFSAIRTAGAVVEILSQQNPTNTSDAEWAGILSSIGLSPLLLASIGLLKRTYVQRHTSTAIAESPETKCRERAKRTMLT